MTTKTSKVDCQLADISDRLSSVQTPKFVTSEGYQKISEELAKLTKQHKQARLNNAELQKRLDTHTENLKLFALSLPELTNQVSGKIIDTCEFSAYILNLIYFSSISGSSRIASFVGQG